MVLPIAFRKLLNDLVDLGSRKSNAQSGQELNFLADSEFVRRHPSTRCANARRLLPLHHRGHPAESIASRRTGRRAISCTQARSDFLLGIPRRLLGIPRRIASVAPTGTLPVPFGLEPAPVTSRDERRDPGQCSLSSLSRGLLCVRAERFDDNDAGRTVAAGSPRIGILRSAAPMRQCPRSLGRSA